MDKVYKKSIEIARFFVSPKVLYKIIVSIIQRKSKFFINIL